MGSPITFSGFNNIDFGQILNAIMTAERAPLNALETQLAREHSTGRFCHGDAPTLADVCLVPQLANARRVALDVARWPTIARIEIACNALPAFVNAAPAKQPDAE